jgi:hypothetical protein
MATSEHHCHTLWEGWDGWGGDGWRLDFTLGPAPSPPPKQGEEAGEELLLSLAALDSIGSRLSFLGRRAALWSGKNPLRFLQQRSGCNHLIVRAAMSGWLSQARRPPPCQARGSQVNPGPGTSLQ